MITGNTQTERHIDERTDGAKLICLIQIKAWGNM